MQVLFLSNDMVFPSRVAGTAQQLGLQMGIVPVVSGLANRLTADCRLVLIDLGLPNLDLASVLAQVKAVAPEAKTVAFGPHVDELLLSNAVAAGCTMVLTKGQFNQGFGQILQQVV